MLLCGRHAGIAGVSARRYSGSQASQGAVAAGRRRVSRSPLLAVLAALLSAQRATSRHEVRRAHAKAAAPALRAALPARAPLSRAVAPPLAGSPPSPSHSAVSAPTSQRTSVRARCELGATLSAMQRGIRSPPGHRTAAPAPTVPCTFARASVSASRTFRASPVHVWMLGDGPELDARASRRASWLSLLGFHSSSARRQLLPSSIGARFARRPCRLG